MNDFSELEAELKQLRPATPDAALVSRVARALAESRPTAAVLPQPKAPRFQWLALGSSLAAAAALLLLARHERASRPASQPARVAAAPAPATAPGYVSDGLTRVLYNQRNEGLVYPANATRPVRRMHSRAEETLHWRNPSTGASLRVSYPTDEVEFIPISGQ